MRWKLAVLALLYLLTGVMWASVGGFWVSEANNRLAAHDHDEVIVEVTHASIDGDAVLRVCVRGRRETCIHRTSPIESFALEIPVALAGQETRGSRRLFVPRDHIAPACVPSTSSEPVNVVRLPETDPSEFFDGLDDDELERLRPPDDHEHAVFEIPMSFDGARFHEMRDVVYVSSVPDEEGTHYYRIRTDSLLTSDRVSGSQRVWAFVRDMFEFPYQILMFLGSGH